MEEVFQIPEGWRRYERNGRIVYFTPENSTHPSVIIHSRAELSQYHRRKRYLQVKPEELVFATKRKQKKVKFEIVNKRETNASKSSEVLSWKVNENYLKNTET